jgi:hypothetical protein
VFKLAIRRMKWFVSSWRTSIPESDVKRFLKENWAPRCQFHQRKTREFFVWTSFLYVRVTRKKLPKRYSYEKSVRITLMKLTKGRPKRKTSPTNEAWWVNIKLSCDSRFQHVFTACSCDFKVITLVGSNQDNYFENVINSRWKCLLQRSFYNEIQVVLFVD